MKSFWLPAVFLLLFSITGLTGCTHTSFLYLANAGEPLSFNLEGDALINRLYVLEMLPDRKEPESSPHDSSDKLLWLIARDSTVRADNLPNVKYGVAPDGFRQDFPLSGSPLPLNEGKKYWLAVTHEHYGKFFPRYFCFRVTGNNIITGCAQ